MKVLVVAPSFPYSTQTFVVREVAETMKRGHDVIVLAPDSGDEPGSVLANHLGIHPNQLLYSNPGKMPFLQTSWKRFDPEICFAANPAEYGVLLGERRKTYFVQLLARPELRDVQLIHAHFVSWAYSVAMPLAHLLGLPFTMTAHDSHLASYPDAQLRLLQSKAVAITLPSSAWKNIWVEKSGSVERLHVLPNAVGTEDFSDFPLARERRHELRLLTVARLVSHKRVSDGLYATRKLLDHDVRCHYTIIGSGPEEEKLHRLAASLEIEADVLFLGAQPHQRVVEELLKADVYVHPSERESFGIAVIEAMAAHLPVVVARSGGVEDIVEDGVTGRLYSPGDIDLLVISLMALASNQEQRIKFGNAGRERATRLYGWDAHMNHLFAMWQETVPSC